MAIVVNNLLPLHRPRRPITFLNPCIVRPCRRTQPTQPNRDPYHANASSINHAAPPPIHANADDTAVCHLTPASRVYPNFNRESDKSNRYITWLYSYHGVGVGFPENVFV